MLQNVSVMSIFKNPHTCAVSESGCTGTCVLLKCPLGLGPLLPTLLHSVAACEFRSHSPLIEAFIALISYSQAALPGAIAGNLLRFVKCQFD